MKKPVYQIAIGENLEALENTVNEAIEAWYEPIGGVSHNTEQYIQPMVLSEHFNTNIEEVKSGENWLPTSTNVWGA